MSKDWPQFRMNLFVSSRVLTNALDNGAYKKNNRICGALLTPLPPRVSDEAIFD